MKIPKIIHQIWSDLNKPLPSYFKILSDTWREHYPGWQYFFWDEAKINNFVLEYYPQYWEIYKDFPYNIQRWDSVRYLILKMYGGMYVDFDYESICSIIPLIKEEECCFALEPVSHCNKFWESKFEQIITNALMCTIPNHPFLDRIIESVFIERSLNHDDIEIHPDIRKLNHTLFTTGPGIITSVYYKLSQKERDCIFLIPDKYVTPFDFNQAHRYLNGDESLDLEECLNEAYAVHYFFSDWRNFEG